MLLLALLALLPPADTVRYEVSFPNLAHHEAEITVTLPALGRDTVVVRMSRSSPGRYAIHEFAKNVYNVRATDLAGQALPVVTRDPYSWRVVSHGGAVRLSYTLFADRSDGTYAAVDRSHAHLNMPAVFAWASGYEALPIAVRFAVPAGSDWRPATQLTPTRDPFTFTAPDLQYFFDSPTELSSYALRSWTVTGPGGRVDTIRIAMHHAGTDAELDQYTARAKRVVAEQVAVYGETARYDHGTYTFIADYLPWASGDGMEHRNSTIISSTGSLERSMNGLLGTLSHEFFHSWNMERIRSAMIEPFDFTAADPSDALWFGEGFTQYYGSLILHRAGVVDEAGYIRTVGGIVNAVTNSPARHYGSPIDMSLHAPFVDAATAIDPTNFGNTFLSYYTWGAGVALGLDLSLRGGFPGKTLDGFMREMWQRFGADGRYTVKRPYTVDDIQRTLADYTGDPGFAADFFRRYVHGREVVDYPALLARAGLAVHQADSTSAYLGRSPARYQQDGALAGTTTVGTPLYDAGVAAGDVIHQIDGRAVASADDWRAIEAAHRPGDEVAITFTSRGQQVTARVRFGTDPRLAVTPVESAGGTLTPAEARFRADWLSSRAN
jgi:predicted metalloprotease with PDZ domain